MSIQDDVNHLRGSFASWLTRSPLRELLDAPTLKIKFTHPLTGRQETLPAHFLREGKLLYLLLKGEPSAWKMLSNGIPVRLDYRGKEEHAWAEEPISMEEFVAILSRQPERQTVWLQWLGIPADVGPEELKGYLQQLPAHLKFIRVTIPA